MVNVFGSRVIRLNTVMNYKKIGKFKCTWAPLHKWQPRVIWTQIRYTMILIMVTVAELYRYTSAPSDFAR